MDQNQTLNSDLQKAIDDITNTTSVDPVFSDPVAAPSSIPEGDSGVMDEAVGPFPTPELIAVGSPVSPEFQPSEVPTMAAESGFQTMPDINMSPMPVTNNTDSIIPPSPHIPSTTISTFSEVPDSSSTPEMQYMSENANFAPPSHNMRQVRESALRDLAPLLGRMTINPSQKFRIYRDMFEDLHDYAVLEPAYQAAKAIADEKERGEALLYLIESIDRI